MPRAETATSEIRDSTLFDAAPHMIHVTDREGIILNINHRELEVLGYSRSELIGRPVMGIVHPQFRRRARMALAAALRGDPEAKFKMWMLTKAGEVVDVQAHTIAERTAARVTGMIQVLRVVTGRLAIERALSESRDMLLGTRRPGTVGAWKAVFSSGKIELDSDTLRVIGIDPSTYDGSAASLLEHVHPQDRQVARDRIAQVLSGHGLEPVDLRVVRPDGETKTLRVTGCVDVGEDGTLFGAIGYIRDVTEPQPLESIAFPAWRVPDQNQR